MLKIIPCKVHVLAAKCRGYAAKGRLKVQNAAHSVHFWKTFVPKCCKYSIARKQPQTGKQKNASLLCHTLSTKTYPFSIKDVHILHLYFTHTDTYIYIYIYMYYIYTHIQTSEYILHIHFIICFIINFIISVSSWLDGSLEVSNLLRAPGHGSAPGRGAFRGHGGPWIQKWTIKSWF